MSKFLKNLIGRPLFLNNHHNVLRILEVTNSYMVIEQFSYLFKERRIDVLVSFKTIIDFTKDSKKLKAAEDSVKEKCGNITEKDYNKVKEIAIRIKESMDILKTKFNIPYDK